MIKKIIFILSLVYVFCFYAITLFAQETTMSLPQPLSYGVSNVKVLGKCSVGSLLYQYGKNADFISCYNDDLNLRWKKEINLQERTSNVEEVFITGDSIIVFYTIYSKGKYILKCNLYSNNLGLLRNAVALDTLPSIFANENIALNISQSGNKKRFLVYYTESDFQDQRVIYTTTLSSDLSNIFRENYRLLQMNNPVILDAQIDNDYHSMLVCADRQARNYNNDYQYVSLAIIHLHSAGKYDYVSCEGNGKYFSNPIFKTDYVHHKILLSGLYANDIGNAGSGTFFMSSASRDTTIFYKQFLPFTDNFLMTLNGKDQLKKSDGYYDFVATDLVVKQDGGLILITEQQDESSETIGSNSFGAMNITPVTVINYFHYNDIVVFSLDSTGAADWYQTLRKKQTSDNDYGFYLSYGLMIGPQSLFLFYNDVVSSQHRLSMYELKINSDNKRDEIIDCDKKNLAPIVRNSKQVSAHEYLIPSVRRGFFQLIKIKI